VDYRKQVQPIMTPADCIAFLEGQVRQLRDALAGVVRAYDAMQSVQLGSEDWERGKN
jgi:hypothetical protein